MNIIEQDGIIDLHAEVKNRGLVRLVQEDDRGGKSEIIIDFGGAKGLIEFLQEFISSE